MTKYFPVINEYEKRFLLQMQECNKYSFHECTVRENFISATLNYFSNPNPLTVYLNFGIWIIRSFKIYFTLKHPLYTISVEQNMQWPRLLFRYQCETASLAYPTHLDGEQQFGGSRIEKKQKIITNLNLNHKTNLFYFLNTPCYVTKYINQK